MFRRSFARPFRRFPADTPPALQRANELMAIGNYLAAALAFEQLAQIAASRGEPRAPWLYVQAGRARLLAGQVPAGMAHLQQGLSLFAARGQWPLLFRAGRRLAVELRQRGLESEAAQIEARLQAGLPAGFTPPAGTTEIPRPVLPPNCPVCGAPLQPDEVDWIGERTAECPYCGSAVRSDS